MFKNLPKFNDQGYIHYVTTKIFDNFQYFMDEKYCVILLEELDFYRKKLDFKILGYVIMPDHLHCLIWWNVEKYPELTIGKIMQGVKSYSARIMLEYSGKRLDQVTQSTQFSGRRGPLTSPGSPGLGQVTQPTLVNRLGQVTQSTQKEYFHQKVYPHRRMSESRYSVWQPGFYDFNIYTEQKFLEKLNYIHDNPRRAGLCQNPEDYKWSSCGQIIGIDTNPILKVDYFEF